jgi:hypothetical protein
MATSWGSHEDSEVAIRVRVLGRSKTTKSNRSVIIKVIKRGRVTKGAAEFGREPYQSIALDLLHLLVSSDHQDSSVVLSYSQNTPKFTPAHGWFPPFSHRFVDPLCCQYYRSCLISFESPSFDLSLYVNYILITWSLYLLIISFSKKTKILSQ